MVTCSAVPHVAQGWLRRGAYIWEACALGTVDSYLNHLILKSVTILHHFKMTLKYGPKFKLGSSFSWCLEILLPRRTFQSGNGHFN